MDKQSFCTNFQRTQLTNISHIKEAKQLILKNGFIETTHDNLFCIFNQPIKNVLKFLANL